MPIWIIGILAYLGEKIDLFSIGFFIASNIRLPYVKRISLSDTQLTELASKLQHGDLIFGRREWFAKNLIVPGEFKHVGIWDARRQLVLEFQNDGYEENSLGTFVARYTRVGVGRPTFREDYAVRFVDKMRTFSDKEYDARFTQNTHQMYCSESVAHADEDNVLRYGTTIILFGYAAVYVPNELLNLPTVKTILKIDS